MKAVFTIIVGCLCMTHAAAATDWFKEGSDFSKNSKVSPSTQYQTNIKNNNGSSTGTPASPTYIPGYNKDSIPRANGSSRNSHCIGLTEAQIKALPKNEQAECNAMKALADYQTSSQISQPELDRDTDPMQKKFSDTRTSAETNNSPTTVTPCETPNPGKPGFTEIKHCTQMRTWQTHTCKETVQARCVQPNSCDIQDSNISGGGLSGDNTMASANYYHSPSDGIYSYSQSFTVKDAKKVSYFNVTLNHVDDYFIIWLVNANGRRKLFSDPSGLIDMYEGTIECTTASCRESYKGKIGLYSDSFNPERPLYETNGRWSGASSSNIASLLTNGVNTLEYQIAVIRNGDNSIRVNAAAQCKVKCTTGIQDGCSTLKSRSNSGSGVVDDPNAGDYNNPGE